MKFRPEQPVSPEQPGTETHKPQGAEPSDDLSLHWRLMNELLDLRERNDVAMLLDQKGTNPVFREDD